MVLTLGGAGLYFGSWPPPYPNATKGHEGSPTMLLPG